VRTPVDPATLSRTTAFTSVALRSDCGESLA